MTYSINSYPSNAGDLKEQQRVDHETALAFKVCFNRNILVAIIGVVSNNISINRLQYWSDQANLSFRRVSQDEADIQIDFFSRDHHDGQPFDGRGKVLAHAAFPELGLLHVDDDERWNSVEGKKCFSNFLKLTIIRDIKS